MATGDWLLSMCNSSNSPIIKSNARKFPDKALPIFAPSATNNRSPAVAEQRELP